MRVRRVLGSIVIVVWLGTLAFVAGPARWELAHTYEHWIDGLGKNLPALTTIVGLPILGVGTPSMTSTLLRVPFWAFAWLGPVGLLIGAWRIESQQALAEWFLYGGALYLAVMLLAFVVMAVSLWIPFSLL
ncbi:MAG: hypothetical protein AB2L07_06560 [Thermoanaerobaculaceae bacterium]